MRRVFIIIITAVMLLTSGCANGVNANYRELSQLQVIEAVGFDASDDGVTVSASTGKAGEGEKAVKLAANGKSLALALENLQSWSYSEEIYYPHTSYLLLGEEAARDTTRYLDFVERSVQIRMSTPLIVVRGSDAASVVTESGGEDGDVVQILASVEEELKKTGKVKLFSCGETALALAQNGAALVCCVQKTENKGIGEGQTVLVDGYAMVKDGSLRGYLRGDYARAASLLLDVPGKGSVALPMGAAVQVSAGGCDIKPVLDEDGALASCTVKLKLNADLEELIKPLDVTDKKVLSALEKELSDSAAGWAREVFAASQKENADFLGVRRTLEIASPSLAETLERDWESIYPALPIDVSVEATIRRTYEIARLASDDGGES